MAFENRREFPPVTWAHNSLQLAQNPFQASISQCIFRPVDQTSGTVSQLRRIAQWHSYSQQARTVQQFMLWSTSPLTSTPISSNSILLRDATGIRANQVHSFLCGVITHPCHVAEPPLHLRHGWGYHLIFYLYAIRYHNLNFVLIDLIFVNI